jgi:hypothetical protein
MGLATSRVSSRSSTGVHRRPGELLRYASLAERAEDTPRGHTVGRAGGPPRGCGTRRRPSEPSSAAGLAAGRVSSSQDLRGDEDTEKATQTTMATWMRVRKSTRARMVIPSCY